MDTMRRVVNRAIELALCDIILVDHSEGNRTVEEDVAVVADAIFKALGLTAVEQASQGGFLMVHVARSVDRWCNTCICNNEILNYNCQVCLKSEEPRMYTNKKD